MLKTLGAQVKEFKKPSMIAAFCTVAEVALEISLPLVTASIIDKGIEAGNLGNVFLYGFFMVLLALASLSMGVGAGHFASVASTGFAKNLRESMYRNIQQYSFANIDKFSTSGLVTRMTTDVTNMQTSYQMLLRMCLRAPITLICALVMSFTINARIAGIFLVAIAFLAVVLGMIVKLGMKYFSEMFKRYDDLNASIQENVSAIRVVKAFVREDFEKEKFGKAANNLYNLSVKAEKIVGYNNPVMNLTVYGCMLMISWLSAQMIVGGTMTTGNLTSLFTYCMNILMSLMMLSMIFVMMSMSVASAKRIVEVIKEESDIVSPKDAKRVVKDGSVDFHHVSFSYDKKLHKGKNVLNDIDIHIKSGETIGILGGTGSGKSSLVNLISRLYDATEGRVCVGGVDVKEYDLEALRNQVSVVLQKNELFSGTILENLRWGDELATKEECIRVCKMACADDFIQRMPDGYDTYIEQGGTNVSGGQKQRLCIARALLKKPKILILDDSTSAVDTATDARIRKAFREEIPGTTKFIIAQRVSSIQDADRILVLDGGCINGFGTHEELLANNEIYRSVYEGQTQGGGDFDEPQADEAEEAKQQKDTKTQIGEDEGMAHKSVANGKTDSGKEALKKGGN